MTRRHAAALGVMLALLGLAGCRSVPSVPDRTEAVADRLQAAGWHSVELRAGAFDLYAAFPHRPPAGRVLTVFIEGDGLAWRSRSRPSTDPTPVSPVALELALAHAETAPDGPVAYLARPCQYTGGLSARGCDESWWTEARFADAVIDATDRAITALKQRFGSDAVVLVGFSGGAAVALLVAARRNDVAALASVAGNLDPVAWTAYHRVTPLSGSLNPVDSLSRLEGLAQVHFTGSDDPIVPPPLARGFADRFEAGSAPTVVEIEGFDHLCCWARDWRKLWAEARGLLGL